jgi:biotin carboxylase
MSARILLVAATTGYQTRSFDAAAQRLGLELALATDRCHVLEDPWRDRAFPIRFDAPALTGRFDGIVAVGDRPAVAAAQLARQLGLPFHPPEAAARARDKHETRKAFAAAGLNVPVFERARLDADAAALAARVAYPCVLKPLGLSASRGVIRADDPAQFRAAFARIRNLLAEPELAHAGDPAAAFLQIERFVPGREFSVEAVLTRGAFQPLAIFDKPEPLDGPFFEETIYVTPSREDAATQAAILDGARAACAALGLTHGAVHAELRVNETGVWPLEVAPRPIGGLCADALRFTGGASLEEVLLRHAAGESLAGLERETAAAGVMMMPVPGDGVFESVDGVADALAVPGVENVIITAKPGQHLRPLPEGASYPGFLFARGPDPERVCASLRAGHARLRFRLAPALRVVR